MLGLLGRTNFIHWWGTSEAMQGLIYMYQLRTHMDILLLAGSLGDFVDEPVQVLSYFNDVLELPSEIAQALLDAQLSFSRVGYISSFKK